MTKRNLDILFLTNEAYPTNRSLLSDLFNESFVNLGNNITWIMRPSDSNKVVTNPNWNKSKLYLTRNYSGNLFDKLKAYIHSSIDKYYISKSVINLGKPDIIQVRNGIIESLISISLSKKYGIKFSFMLSSMHGFYDDKEILKDYDGFRYYYKSLEFYFKYVIYKRIISSSDFFQPITKSMEKALLKNQVKIQKSFPLPLCSSDRFVNYQGSNVSKRYTLVYLGSIRKSRDIEFIIKSFLLVNESIKDCSLLIIGGSEEKGDIENLKKLIDNHEIANKIKITGRIDRIEVPHYLKKAKIGLSPIPPNRKFKVSSPSKIVEYMSMSLPVVANYEIHDHRNLLKKSRGGILTRYDVEEYSKAIIFLCKRNKLSTKMGFFGKKWISMNRNYSTLSKELEKQYHEIVS